MREYHIMDPLEGGSASVSRQAESTLSARLCRVIRSLQNRCESAFEEADLEDACEAEAAAFYGDTHGKLAGFSCWMRGFRRGLQGYGK